jgi:GT2 family glycosyltransferase
MNTPPLVAIVILNWQNAPDTIECLASVAGLSYQNYQTIVVDNGSKDNSVRAIRAAFPGVNLIALPENLGYAAGNNVGILQAVNSGADYLFVLNNDTLLTPDILQQLVKVAEANPQVGMVGPKMYCYQPKDAIFAAGSMIQWWQGDIYHRGMFLTDAAWNDPPQPEPVDFITGCGVLVRRSLIETVGVLDTSYFLNYEDVEWCVRAQGQGFAIWYAPEAVMWHKVSATLGESSPANTYYMTRNSLYFFWHHLTTINRWLTISRIIIRTLYTTLTWSVRKQYRNRRYYRLRQANLLALRDFFRGKSGQMEDDVAAVCYNQLE